MDSALVQKLGVVGLMRPLPVAPLRLALLLRVPLLPSRALRARTPPMNVAVLQSMPPSDDTTIAVVGVETSGSLKRVRT